MSKEIFSPAMQAGMDDVVRGMATARICRSAIAARNLLLNSIAESRAERVLGQEDRETVADTLAGINRLIERFGPRKGEGD